MIEQLSGFPDDVIAVSCRGRIAQADYDTVLVPAVEAALKHHQQLRLYYQIESDFAGIEPGAMWEDFKVGVANWTRWKRIAVVTDVDWIRHTMLAFGFLMPGSMKVFPLADAQSARAWITDPME